VVPVVVVIVVVVETVVTVEDPLVEVDVVVVIIA
jgi:hypothetical protein